jgi:hypothetical protein
MSTIPTEISGMLSAQDAPRAVAQRLEIHAQRSQPKRQAGKFLSVTMAYHGEDNVPKGCAGLMARVYVGSMAVAVDQTLVHKACAALPLFFKPSTSVKHARKHHTTQQSTQASRESNEKESADPSKSVLEPCHGHSTPPPDPTELLRGGVRVTVQTGLFCMAVGCPRARWLHVTADVMQVCLDSRHESMRFFSFQLAYAGVHVTECPSGSTQVLGPACDTIGLPGNDMINLLVERGRDEDELADGDEDGILPKARVCEISTACQAAPGLLADRVYMFRSVLAHLMHA